MKILLVSSFLPYPLFSGGHVRLFNIIKQLSKKNEITLVCEKRKHQTQKDIDEVKKLCKEVYVVERKKQWSPEVIFQTTISSLPFLLAGHRLSAMTDVLEKLLKEKQFDVIHVETFYVMQNVPPTQIPIVLVEHNVEYSVYQRFVNNAPFLLRPLLQIDVEKIKYWEKKSWSEATKVVAVSEKEAKQMRSDAMVVPNGVDLASFPFKKSADRSKEETILFMGDFKWIQNRDTASWILKDIWPTIKAGLKENAKLWIVGKHIPDSLKNMQEEGVVFDEHAPDKTSDIYKRADILLSPIRIGGGTSYKILEAMASGIPVVTTELGVEGLKAKDGKQAIVRESSSLLGQAVISLIASKKQYDTIRKSARDFIEKEYSWEKITKTLEGVYEDAVKK